jgi:phosphatidylglycerol:prolipoprotein diacylglycerol transferase
MIWDWDPVALSLGPVEIRWYGMLFAAAFVIGYHLMVLMSRWEGRDPAPLERLFAFAVVGTLVGARLGHCLAYDPQWYLAHPWEILKIWEGGLASHGGAVGLVGGILLARLRHPQVDVVWIVYRLPVPAGLGGALIRLGNFWNSELVGMPTSVPWAVVFARVDMVPRHPVQLYEALTYAAVAVALGVMYVLRPRWRDLSLGVFLVAVFGSRIVWEAFKMPQAVTDTVGGVRMGQMLSVPFVLLGAVLVVWQWRRMDRRVGGA